MRKHLLQLLVLLCMLPIALLLCVFALPSQYDNTFLGEMKDKVRLLRQTPGKRIVVVGGSSVPFAMQTALMQEYFPDYTVIDFGMYADLGMPVLLDLARAEVHAGDIFVLMPEQDRQMLSDYVGDESVWQACDGAFDQLLLLSPARYEALSAAFPMFAGKKLRYALLGQPQVEGIYAHSSFDEYGDITYPDREYNILADGWQTTQQMCFETDFPKQSLVEEMNAFAAYVRSKGGEVVYHFAPMNALALAEGADVARIDAYYDALSLRLDMPILGDPHRCVMDSGWFYDSNFHLNRSGSIVFTKMLTEDIKVYLRDTSETAITVPSIPAIVRKTIHGEDRDADCFVYQETEEGWLLCGLTEKGTQAAELILPTWYKDRPVVGVVEGLLRNRTRLQQVTIQPNIRMLTDGMFSGCVLLQTVCLTGEASDYSVGDAWMQGASFVIQVPEQALDAYRRSYFWQQYEAWLKAEP